MFKHIYVYKAVNNGSDIQKPSLALLHSVEHQI